MSIELYLGIDPGITGGWALIRPDGEPVATGEFTWFRAIQLILEEKLGKLFYQQVFTVLEHAQAFRGQGVCSMFTYGANFGGWEATLQLLQLPYQLVKPKIWQQAVLGGFPKGESKPRACAFVQKRWPTLELHCKKKNEGIIDALCMALYAKRLESTVKEKST